MASPWTPFTDPQTQKMLHDVYHNDVRSARSRLPAKRTTRFWDMYGAVVVHMCSSKHLRPDVTSALAILRSGHSKLLKSKDPHLATVGQRHLFYGIGLHVASLVGEQWLADVCCNEIRYGTVPFADNHYSIVMNSTIVRWESAGTYISR